tara:strand:- start:444 stop:1202 length:759 start_codon:yes stop_codon:yes gene_type:complete
MSENNQFSEGCSRCSDYDKLKDDLENLNEKSKNEQREALKSCEQGRELLQKKLLKVGAIAVIGGTVVGKELIDKVANYIESFNKVTDLISYNTPTITAPVSSAGEQVAQNDADDEEDDKKDDKKVVTKDNKPFDSPWFGPDPYDTIAYGGSFLSGESYMDPIVESFLTNEMMSLSVLPNEFDMASLIEDFALSDSLNTIDYPWTNAFELPGPFIDNPSMPQQAMIIPDAGTGIPFLFAIPLMGFMRHRRRNT